jgi:two-component system phosphate regulon sensor histidine kinase PhoR
LQDGQVFVQVTDKGIGISSDQQKHIFDKFYRVSGGLVHNTKGSGLGLTLVDYSVRAHSGTIEVKSKPGQGSTFRLIFPVSKKSN